MGHVWWSNKSSHLQVHSFCPFFFLRFHFELCASIFQWAATPAVKGVNACNHPCCFEWGFKGTEATEHGTPAEEEENAVWRVWDSKYEATPLLGKEKGSGTLSAAVLRVGSIGSTLPVLLGLTCWRRQDICWCKPLLIAERQKKGEDATVDRKLECLTLPLRNCHWSLQLGLGSSTEMDSFVYSQREPEPALSTPVNNWQWSKRFQRLQRAYWWAP